MSLEENIKDALEVYLRDVRNIEDIDYVLSFEDFTASDGYCSTCYYEYAAFKVKYRTLAGGTKEWVYNDSFAELVSSL